MKSDGSTNRTLQTGELARLSGVSADTIRFYERKQLLPDAPRTATGYRVFPPEALARVKLIRAALSIGFSVVELADVFRQRESGVAPCRRVRELAAEKLAVLDARLRDMQSWRRELRRILSDWDVRLSRTPGGKQARLLEAFASNSNNQPGRMPFDLSARGNRSREKRK